MAKFVAPDNVALFTMDGMTYSPGDDGVFNIEHPEHIAHAKRLGAVDYTGDRMDSFTPAEPDARDDRIAELEAQLAAATKAPEAVPVHVETVDAMLVPTASTEPLGGTSSAAESHVAAPDYTTMSRDDMVAWLAANGVAVSPAISKNRAQEIIEATVVDLAAGQSLAAVERTEDGA